MQLRLALAPAEDLVGVRSLACLSPTSQPESFPQIRARLKGKKDDNDRDARQTLSAEKKVLQ